MREKEKLVFSGQSSGSDEKRQKASCVKWQNQQKFQRQITKGNTCACKQHSNSQTTTQKIGL